MSNAQNGDANGARPEADFAQVRLSLDIQFKF